MKKLALIIILCILITSCQPQQSSPLQKPENISLQDLVSVLETSGDYQEFISRNPGFELELKDSFVLTQNSINSKVREWNESGKLPYKAVFEGFNLSSNHYFIEANDKNSSKGFIAVLDLNSGQVLNFFALIIVKQKIGG